MSKNMWARGDMNVASLKWDIDYHSSVKELKSFLNRTSSLRPLILFTAPFPLTGMRNLTGLVGSTGLVSIHGDILLACIHILLNESLYNDDENIRDIMLIREGERKFPWSIDKEKALKDSRVIKLVSIIECSGIVGNLPILQLETKRRKVYGFVTIPDRLEHHKQIRRSDGLNPSWHNSMTRKIIPLTDYQYYGHIARRLTAIALAGMEPRYFFLRYDVKHTRIQLFLLFVELGVLLNDKKAATTVSDMELTLDELKLVFNTSYKKGDFRNVGLNYADALASVGHEWTGLK